MLHHPNGIMSERSIADAESIDPKRATSHAIRPTTNRRTRSVFTRLTEAEYARIEQQAGELKVNVYARYVLLKESNVQLLSEEYVQMLLEELLALRMIVLNLHGKGPECVMSVKQQADQAKVQAAKERNGQR